MKYLALFLIGIYQWVGSGVLSHIFGIKATCRYSPTCSEYARQSIKEHGIVVGGYCSVLRILSCQSFVSLKFKVQSSKLQLTV